MIYSWLSLHRGSWSLSFIISNLSWLISPDSYLPLIWHKRMRLAKVVMVTFAETTQVSPMELHEPHCLAPTLSPGLRRKKMLWQNAVKHIIIQQELSAQVTHHVTTDSPLPPIIQFDLNALVPQKSKYACWYDGAWGGYTLQTAVDGGTLGLKNRRDSSGYLLCAGWRGARTKNHCDGRLHSGYQQTNPQQGDTRHHKTPFLLLPSAPLPEPWFHLHPRQHKKVLCRLLQWRRLLCELGPHSLWDLPAMPGAHLQVPWPGETLPAALLAAEAQLSSHHQRDWRSGQVARVDSLPGPGARGHHRHSARLPDVCVHDVICSTVHPGAVLQRLHVTAVASLRRPC